LAPAGVVGGGSYTSSDFGVQLLDVHKYYIVAAASSSSSNRYTASRVPLTPRRRNASRYGPLGLAILTAGAFRYIRAMPYGKAGPEGFKSKARPLFWGAGEQGRWGEKAKQPSSRRSGILAPKRRSCNTTKILSHAKTLRTSRKPIKTFNREDGRKGRKRRIIDEGLCGGDKIEVAWSSQREEKMASPTIRYNSKGRKVADLQKRLFAQGFNPGPVD